MVIVIDIVIALAVVLVMDRVRKWLEAPQIVLCLFCDRPRAELESCQGS